MNASDTPQSLTEDQREALQEITNIGMGQAGASIHKVIGEFVVLSIPTIRSVLADDLPQILTELLGAEPVSATRQGFYAQMKGEALVVFAEHSATDLAELMSYDDVVDDTAESELLLDISNLLVGACLGGIAELLKSEIGFSPPAVLALRRPAGALLTPGELAAKCALLVEVQFKLESRKFNCHLIMLMPDGEMAPLAAALDRFIEAL